MQYENLLKSVTSIAKEAGDKILDIYHTDYGVTDKDDNRESPLTEADTAAHELIHAELSRLTPDIPVLSEEGDEINDRQSQERIWVVDPLDGTKEFIQQKGEFTVNIALVENGEPVLGVVHAPALATTYTGLKEAGAWVEQNNEKRKIAARGSDTEHVKIVASSSHRDENTQAFLDQFPETDITSIGSSLKLCLVAEGSAALYPRFAPTMEWDTAAGDAVARAAGGNSYQLNGEPLQYNKTDLYNPFFIVTATDAPEWQSKLPKSLLGTG